MFLKIIQIGIIMSILVGNMLFGAYNFEVALRRQKISVFVRYLIILLVYIAQEYFLLEYSYLTCGFLVFPYAVAVIAFFFYQTYDFKHLYGWAVLLITPFLIISFWAYHHTLNNFNWRGFLLTTSIYFFLCLVMNQCTKWSIYWRMAAALCITNFFVGPCYDFIFFTIGPKTNIIFATLVLGTAVQLLLSYFYFVSLNRRIMTTNSMKFDLFHDELTGLMNYRAFSQYVVKQGKGKDNLIICMLDLDHFKIINDSYGHLVGNAALAHFAHHFRRFILQNYPKGKIYRFGGDEFCCMVLEPDKARFVKLMKRFEDEIQEQKFQAADGAFFGLTFSAGISQAYPDSDIMDTFQRADARAYTAKRKGRAQIYFGDVDSKISD